MGVFQRLTAVTAVSLSIMFSCVSVHAQWINDNIARENARPNGPIFCRINQKGMNDRQAFLQDLRRQNIDLLKLAKRTVAISKETLEDMEAAHYASDVAEVVSSVAGLFAGGMAIRSLYFSGKSVAFMGMTVAPGTIPAHAYSVYSIASNGAPLVKTIVGSMSKDKTPEEILREQMRDFSKQGLMSRDAAKFIMLPNWSGSSALIESPLIEGAFTQLMNFYEKEKKKIGNKNSLWQSLGEFWHEKGLRHSALTYAVAKETLVLQDMRVKYLEMLSELLRQHHEYCYGGFLR